MRTADLPNSFRSLLEGNKNSVMNGGTLPADCYVNNSLVPIETSLIFRRHWLCIGRADRLQREGDYVALDFANQSVVLLRDRRGRFGAFANSCRHRGARLLNGQGNIARLRCPLHGWTYGLDGRLSGAPHMSKVADFRPNEFSLRAYRVAVHFGFVFICLSPTAPDIDNTLSGFSDIHAPWPIETLISTRHRTFEVACNWKSFLEIFNEYYHLPLVHPSSLDKVYNAPEESESVDGAFATQFGSTVGTGGLLSESRKQSFPTMPGLTGHEARGVRYTWVFPNMAFAAGSDALWMYEAYPLDAGRCLVHQTACFPPDTVQLANFDEIARAYYSRLDLALDEDILALINQQRGLACPDASQGRFQPLLESNVASFARWYTSQMLI